MYIRTSLVSRPTRQIFGGSREHVSRVGLDGSASDASTPAHFADAAALSPYIDDLIGSRVNSFGFICHTSAGALLCPGDGCGVLGDLSPSPHQSD